MEAESARGRVKRRVVAAGSKSERDAVVLETGSQTYILRRRGANPFTVDDALAALVGRSVEVRGTAAGTTFLVDDWTEGSE